MVSRPYKQNCDCLIHFATPILLYEVGNQTFIRYEIGETFSLHDWWQSIGAMQYNPQADKGEPQ